MTVICLPLRMLSLALAASSFLNPPLAYPRNVYLNGVDISGAVNQSLKKVDLLIDSEGDVYVSAPNYQVYEENQHLPLSLEQKIPEPPSHKSMVKNFRSEKNGKKNFENEGKDRFPAEDEAKTPQAAQYEKPFLKNSKEETPSLEEGQEFDNASVNKLEK